MRDYKFRGKRKDNGEWVTGSLIDKDYILQYIDLAESWTPLTSDHKITCRAYAVIPETVGQFTGLKDKYGKDVYEGDVYTPNYGYENEFYPVMFISGAFVGGDNPGHCQPLGWEDDNIDTDLWFSIVGNIHDNPELLNPPADSPALNTMQNFDPKEGQEEQHAAGEAVAAEAQNAQESASQDQAMEVKDSEEGTTEG